MTGRMTARSGMSSEAWDTPGGVMMSMAFGTVSGSSEQIGCWPPGAHTDVELLWLLGLADLVHLDDDHAFAADVGHR
jgi:hypothetical protein